MLIGDLIKEVSRDFDILPADLLGKSQRQDYIPARFALYAVLRRLGMPVTRIGSVCGGRDHKTIRYGVERAEWMMERDSIYREKIERLAQLEVDLTMARVAIDL